MASAEINEWDFFMRDRVWLIFKEMPSPNFGLKSRVTAALRHDSSLHMTDDLNWKFILASILEKFGCQTGTIHQTAVDNATLNLIYQIGVPPNVLAKITTIPFGKGIAGAAAERKEPVELCNLQQDLGGIAEAAARQTGISGSIAVPVFDATTRDVVGTLGIGKYAPYEFTDEETYRLSEFAKEIAELLKFKTPSDD